VYNRILKFQGSQKTWYYTLLPTCQPSFEKSEIRFVFELFQKVLKKVELDL
jgi:hypothetical protein